MNDNDYLPLGDDGEFAADMHVPNRSGEPTRKIKGRHRTQGHPVMPLKRPKWQDQMRPQSDQKQANIAVACVVFIWFLLLLGIAISENSETKAPRQSYPYE